MCDRPLTGAEAVALYERRHRELQEDADLKNGNRVREVVARLEQTDPALLSSVLGSPIWDTDYQRLAEIALGLS